MDSHQDCGRHSIYIINYNIYYHKLSIYTLYPRSEVALANIPWCTSWDMTCPGSCLTSGQVMVLTTCWWEFFDSKHLRLEPCLNDIHEPNKWCQMFRIGSVLGLSLPCLHGTVMIGERGKFVARWGPKHTVRINMRVPRDRYIWKDSQKQWLWWLWLLSTRKAKI